MSSNKFLENRNSTSEYQQTRQSEALNLVNMGLDESEDIDVLNEDCDDVTEIESHNVEDNLDDLQALISDTQSIFISSNQFVNTFRCT